MNWIRILGKHEPWPPVPGLAADPRPLPKVHIFRREGVAWEAITNDGVYGMDRLDEPGTPWELIHLESGQILARCPSLYSCQRRILDIEDGNYTP